MLNTQIYSPTLRPFAFDEDMGKKTLVAIDVCQDGTLIGKDIEDNDVNYVFSGITTPYRLVLQIKKIIGDGSGGVGNGTTGTNIPLAKLKGLH